MVTRVELFRKRMEQTEKIYSRELRDYAMKFPVLGEMSLRERPDIDTLDYIYSFKKTTEASQEDLDLIHSEIYDHMEKFSKEKGIHEFYMNTVIYI